MANVSSLQTTTKFGIQDWTAIYSQVPSNPMLDSYDFETLRKSMINYLQANNAETYNDYIQSSEYVSLIDLIAFMGQAMSYRFDLNARESFLSTAQTRNAITSIANTINYIPSRNLAANGYLKFNSISINDDVYDSLGNNLNGIVITWNDKSNKNWFDQWNSIINAVLVSSQVVGNPGNTQLINGISYAEYSLNCPTNQYPPYSFSASVDTQSMNFEIVNPTSMGQNYIYEVGPLNTSTFNILYETDGNGYSSQNTGFFFYFKQGTTGSQTFSISNALPNYSFTLTNTGINNTDVWLYQINSDGTYTRWNQVDSVYSNNSSVTSGNIFSISNLVNDGITLSFGDGVFGNIPNGNFVVFARSSNGLTYRINPSEISYQTFQIPYTSKINRTQVLTVKASLLYTVGNSSATESLSNIKLKAPQSYYSQNRMVNGQDYNSFPFTKFSSLLQVTAVNRVSSGISRYLDVNDPTGKYSSTNIFGNDGFMYMDDSIQTQAYTYSGINALATSIQNNLSNIMADSTTMSFVFDEYSANDFSNVGITWNMVLNDNTSSSGYITNNSNVVINVNDATSLLVPGAIIEFIPPTGYMFDNNNNLVINASGIAGLNQTSAIYSTIVGSPIHDGYGNSIEQNGTNVDGTGAIQLNAKVPSGAVLGSIFPFYTTSIPNTILTTIIKYLNSGLAVALQYFPSNVTANNYIGMWKIITSPTFPLNYSPSNYGTSFVTPTSSGATSTNSWLIAIVPTSTNGYTLYNRSHAYYFGSEQQTSFYYDSAAKVYDPINATTLTDRITILKVNSAPSISTNLGLSEDVPVDIFSTVNNLDGTIDNSRVGIQYADLYSTGIPSNPTFFSSCVGPNDYVFFVTDNTTSTTQLLTTGIIVSSVATINANLYSYANGTIIFCQSNKAFYKISRYGTTATKTLLNNAGDTLTYTCYNGRYDLKFQYRHNAADSRRIDPSPANVIDIYCLENSYALAYQQWVEDTTGQVAKPDPPNTQELSSAYGTLNNYKMVSDELIFNSAQFVPLFGDKADPTQQATVVAVTNPNTNVSSGEIASNIIILMNAYFAIGNFTFGQPFYWSALSNYLITNLGSMVSSVNLVPTANNMAYGSLEQITCDPYQIFISCATVSDVLVVSSLNNLNLRINN